MQLNIQELIAFAGTLPAQFADMQPEMEGGTTDQIRNKVQYQLSALDREAQKDASVLSREKLIQKYGHTIADRAIEAAQSQVLTPQQATTKFRRALRLAAQEYGKDLRTAGVKPMQHSAQDFVHVLRTQQELQLNGENPSANEVLHLA